MRLALFTVHNNIVQFKPSNFSFLILLSPICMECLLFIRKVVHYVVCTCQIANYIFTINTL